MKAVFFLVLLGFVSYGSGVRQEERDTLGNVVTEFSHNLKEFLVKYGVSEEQQAALIAEFEEAVKNIPIPPLSPWQWMKPSVVFNYMKEVNDYIFGLIEKIKAKVTGSDKVERGISLDIKLPGGSLLLGADFSGIEKYLREKFAELGLKVEDQDRLIGEYNEFVATLPQIRVLDFLNPFKMAKTLEYITARIGEFVANVLQEAGSLVKDILIKERSIRLPGLADIVDHYREHVSQILDKLTGLKGDQRSELIKEFLQKLRDFPNEKKWHTLKPSQIGQYLKEVKEYVDQVVEDIVAKAKQYIEKNKGESKRSIAEIGQRLPGMRDLVEQLKKSFEEKLDSKVSGLTEDQRRECVESFLEGIRNFANVKGITSLAPSGLRKFLKDIKEYAEAIGDATCEKAKILAAGNSHEKRAIEIPQFVKDLTQRLITSFKNAVQHITGLTHDQQDELLEEFKTGIKNVPVPEVSLNPAKWVKYIGDLVKHSIDLTKTLLAKAKDMLSGNKETRALNVNALLEEVELQFKNILGNVGGLTPEETEQLVQEFKDHLDTFPTMNFVDWFSPSKVFDYLKDLRSFSLKLTSMLLEKAKAIVDYRLHGKPETRGISIELDIGLPEFITNWGNSAGGQAKVPNFSAILESIKQYGARIGLTEDELNFFLHRVELELNKYPKAPTGLDLLNPFSWARYLTERTTFVKKIVEKAVKDADAYVKTKTASQKPDC